MRLTPESVREFIYLYKTNYGVELSNEEAEAMGIELLSLYRIISPTS